MPPVSTSTPAARESSAVRRSASSFAPRMVRSWRSLNSSVAASLNAVAFAAITCISGPPCWPGGNTFELSFLASSVSRLTMKPERTVRRCLVHVELTTSAKGTGEGCSPAATRPAKCAMSTHSFAPTSSAISRNAAKSSGAGRPTSRR